MRGAIEPLVLAAVALLLMLAVPECPSATATTAFMDPAVISASMERHEAVGCTVANEPAALRSPAQHAPSQHLADSGADEIRLRDDQLPTPRPSAMAVHREAMPPRGQTMLLLLSVLRT